LGIWADLSLRVSFHVRNSLGEERQVKDTNCQSPL